MRSVESCDYRAEVIESGGGETATCGLVRAIVGVDEAGACRVGRDACVACRAESDSSPERINSVIASLLSKVADGVLARGGVSGCDTGKAAGIARWARENLQVEFPGGMVPLPVRITGRCHFLGAPLTAGRSEDATRFECHHPSHPTTTPDDCRRCRDWSDRPQPAPRPIGSLLPPPGQRSGPAVRRWAVGMTTAPRRHPTVEWSLDSLGRAGWEAPRLFVDSPGDRAAWPARVAVTTRATRLGAWPNFFLGLAELLMADPHADAYLMVQDDAFFDDRQDLRAYLEASVLWPTDPPGLVSLYCPSAYTQPEPGWHAHPDRWVWGALAFLFPNDLARQFVLDPEVWDHRRNGPNEGRSHVDVVIGRWAARHRVPIHFPTPSLVQHIGDHSALWRLQRATGSRRADRFLGDLDR